jgi:hypothetical protein
MPKRKTKQAPARKGKRARAKSLDTAKGATIAELEKQNEKLNNHMNMCVRRLNLLTGSVQFLKNKMLEQTLLYNEEFNVLHARCSENTLFDDFVAEFSESPDEPLSGCNSNVNVEDSFMSEQELIDAIAHF